MQIILGTDKHFQSKEPFYSALQKHVEWFNSQSWNNKDNYYFDLGDIFNLSLPDPNTVDLVERWFDGMKFKKIFLLQGNHEYSGVRGQSALNILRRYPNVQIIDFLDIIHIENIKTLCLPFYYPSQQEIQMYEFYNNLPDTITDQKYDYIFTHVVDETYDFGNKKNYVDLSSLNGRIIQGHCHKPTDRYLGSMVHRYDEKGMQQRMGSISLETKELTYFEVPKFLDYEDIKYPDDLVFNYDFPIFSISNCIDKDASRTYYLNKYPDKKLYFRELTEIEKEDTSKLVNSKIVSIEQKSQKEQLTEFFKTKKYNQDIQNICFNYIR